jgi:hypothetical protein
MARQSAGERAAIGGHHANWRTSRVFAGALDEAPCIRPRSATRTAYAARQARAAALERLLLYIKAGKGNCSTRMLRITVHDYPGAFVLQLGSDLRRAIAFG